jgi:hypothetical protein
MDKSQITEMKVIIKQEYELKIDKLRKEMEDALLSLARVEKTLVEEAVDIGLERKFATQEPQRSKLLRLKQPVSLAVTAEKRILNALQEMNEEFYSRELFEKANSNGYGKEIKRGSFAPIFADLIKNRKIIVVKEPKGNQGGIYRKAAQQETQSESSPATR